MTSDEVQVLGLTEHRVFLLRKAAENLLEIGGYRMKGEEMETEGCWLHLTVKNTSREEERGCRRLLCGPVVNSATKTKEARSSPEDYRRLRLEDMRRTSESKNLKEQLLQSLVDACIKISLLQVKSSQAVILNLEQECQGPRESGSKGGAFLQYNASRMAAIRKKYGELARLGIYPQVPPPEAVDFSLLKEQEEWALLFNFILEYPSIIEKFSKEMTEGRSNIHQICNFLSRLCALFSVYYRRVRILLEPKDHLLPIIQARLLLVMSVEQILENGLSILNINKIEEM